MRITWNWAMVSLENFVYSEPSGGTFKTEGALFPKNVSLDGEIFTIWSIATEGTYSAPLEYMVNENETPVVVMPKSARCGKVLIVQEVQRIGPEGEQDGHKKIYLEIKHAAYMPAQEAIVPRNIDGLAILKGTKHGGLTSEIEVVA